MQKLKQGALMVVLVAATLAMMRCQGKAGRSEYEVRVRLRDRVQAAQDKLPRPPALISPEQIEIFAADLRGVDSTGAPEALRLALSNYVAAVEHHRDRLRATGIWDTNTAWQIGEAQGEFDRALKAPYRGLPALIPEKRTTEGAE